ncbi:MAG: chemotaxis protein CheD, partial [Cyclobacteriaceae bacterium]|nr:chemotaxis protein CheD [Cyclobacteriaceae bacterium]
HDFLNIGEVKAFKEPARLTCYGLGSCIGVFLYDFQNKVGGGAHIALSKNSSEGNSENPLQFAEEALKELLIQVDGVGILKPTSLRAKVIGGANVMKGDGFKIGQKNIETVKKFLVQNQVFIAGLDVGGNDFRTGKFETSTGKLIVTTSTKKYEI